MREIIDRDIAALQAREDALQARIDDLNEQVATHYTEIVGVRHTREHLFRLLDEAARLPVMDTAEAGGLVGAQTSARDYFQRHAAPYVHGSGKAANSALLATDAE